MKTNWQSYLELTDSLLRYIDLCLEEAWLMRESFIEGEYVKRGMEGRFGGNIGAVQSLLFIRERILRDTGEW